MGRTEEWFPIGDPAEIAFALIGGLERIANKRLRFSFGRLVQRQAKRGTWVAVVLGCSLGADAARIMRAPGTLNLKNRKNPRPCRVIAKTPDTWSLTDLLAEVPPLPVKRVKVKLLPTGTADDPIKRVPPPVYFAALTGLEPGRDGMVSCPLHDDRTPSCRIYDEPDRGWWCFGCQAGGDVYDLAARLCSVPTTGRAFIELRQRIAAALIGGSHD